MNKRTIKRMFAAMMCAVMLLTCAPLNGLGTKSYAATNIPSDAVVYNGHSYKVYLSEKTWIESKTYCESVGGHLVTISSKDENDFVKSLIHGSKMDVYCIGIYNANGVSDTQKGHVEWSNPCWVNGEKYSYSNWDDTCPLLPCTGEKNGICNYGFILSNGYWDTFENNALESDYVDDEEYDINYLGFICEWENVKADATLNYNNSIKLEPKTKLVEGEKYTITWKTSDSNIATVDNDGTVTAVKRGSGTVTITCIIIDSHGNTFVDTFIIVVKLSLIQWIIIFILFGWLWY